MKRISVYDIKQGTYVYSIVPINSKSGLERHTIFIDFVEESKPKFIMLKNLYRSDRKCDEQTEKVRRAESANIFRFFKITKQEADEWLALCTI